MKKHADIPKTYFQEISIISFVLLFFLSAGCYNQSFPIEDTIIILSINDLHGQFHPYTVKKGDFGSDSVGGIARIATVIKETKKKYPGAVIAVSAGDNFMGAYFQRFKGEATYNLLSLTGIDVGIFGNHEFDKGTPVLAKALSYCVFPVVMSNLYVEKANPLKNKYIRYLVMERKGIKLGIIGLVTPSFPLISTTDEGIFVNPDVISATRTLTKKLKNRENVDLVMAITHIGLTNDIKLAENVLDLDIICGGHSHIFLDEGQAHIVKRSRSDERVAIVTQAGEYGKYVGMLKLKIKNKRIQGYQWLPVHVNSKIKPDGKVLELLSIYDKKLSPVKILAKLDKPLDCRSDQGCKQETNAGNLICDALREYFKVDMAMQNCGGIRTNRMYYESVITSQDIDNILPFENKVIIIKVKGSLLKQVLERSVSKLPRLSGKFLQVSGIKYVVDINNTPQKLKLDQNGKPIGIKIPGNRIIGIKILGPNNKYFSLDPEQTYTMAVNSYLYKGGDGYWMFSKAESAFNTHVKLSQVVKSYLEKHGGQIPGIEGRITIFGGQVEKDGL